jgi:copper chaperone NosL
VTRLLSALAGATLLVAACAGPAPRAIAWGEDECDHCHMGIADQRFAAQLVTKTGRTFVFDDAGCMARFVADGGVPVGDVHSWWLSDVAEPGTLHQATGMGVIRSDSLRTPMASGLAATRAARADSVAAALGATRVMAWTEVLAEQGVTP